MTAAGQQDMITILWAYKFKQNELCMGLLHGPNAFHKRIREDCLGTVTPLNVFVNMNKKSMILIGFQQFLLYDKTQPIGLGNINKHSIA